MKNSVKHLFVYGTLLRGSAPSPATRLTKMAKLLGKGTLPGADLFDLGEYPGAVRSKKRSALVQGEIFELNATNMTELLRILDEYEEFIPGDPSASLFVRKAESIRFEGHLVPAWTYWYNGPLDRAVRLADGSYSFRRKAGIGRSRKMA